jgi:hypothetical protein
VISADRIVQVWTTTANTSQTNNRPIKTTQIHPTSSLGICWLATDMHAPIPTALAARKVPTTRRVRLTQCPVCRRQSGTRTVFRLVRTSAMMRNGSKPARRPRYDSGVTQEKVFDWRASAGAPHTPGVTSSTRFPVGPRK